MKRLLLVTAAVLALAAPASADVIVGLGTNPDSGAGAFANTNPGTGGGGAGVFADFYTFDLVGSQVLTIAFATNTFAGGDIQKITSFQGAVFNDGPNNAPGGGDDVLVQGPDLATGCIAIPNCQTFGGSAVLAGGHYYLAITGDAGANAGYGGNLSTFAVPGPVVGAGLPGILAMFGMGGWAWRRRRLVG